MCFPKRLDWRGIAVVLVLGALCAGGCGRGLTMSNYQKIKPGMTKSQVEAILGPGKPVSSADASAMGITMSGEVLVWEDGMKSIVVSFVNGKVVSKAQFGL